MSELSYFVPELILAITIAGVVISEIGYLGEKLRFLTGVTLMGLLAALIQMVWVSQQGPQSVLGGIVVSDGISSFFKFFFVLLGLAVVLLTRFSKEISERRRAEFYAFLTAGVLAMSLAAGAGNLLLLFMSLQFLNLVGYLLAGYSKENPRSSEAALKLMGFGILSGALFLYGTGLLFQVTETLNLYQMRTVLSEGGVDSGRALVIFVLFFLSFSFYFGAFPMYFWMPDVLEGAPTPTSVFLALGFPATGFAVGVRFFICVFDAFSGAVEWRMVVALAAGVTMLIGALLALRQVSAKRMLAATLVSQMGFLLMGLVVLDQEGVSALLFNWVVLLFSVVGAFSALSFFGSDSRCDDLQSGVTESICFILFLASMIGFPPLPGFIAKFVLIGAVVREEWHVLGLVATVSSVLLAIVFGRMTFHLVSRFVETSRVGGAVLISGQRRFLVSLLVPVTLLTFLASAVLDWTMRSAKAFFW